MVMSPDERSVYLRGARIVLPIFLLVLVVYGWGLYRKREADRAAEESLYGAMRITPKDVQALVESACADAGADSELCKGTLASRVTDARVDGLAPGR